MFWSLIKLFISFTLIISATTITAGHIINSVIPQPTPTPTPFISESISSDPYIDCGPGQHSKQTTWIRQSICKNYLDCQLTNGTWKFMSKAECDEIHSKKTATKAIQKFDCVGPDGVHMTDKTQEECDKFNAAWNRKPTNATSYTSISNRPTSSCPVAITIDCGIQSRPGYMGIGCTYEEAQKSCQTASTSFGKYETCKSEKNTIYESCKAPCNSKHDQEKDICAYAYMGSSPGIELNPTKYGECLDESSAIWNSCTNACQNTYFAALDTCSSQ